MRKWIFVVLVAGLTFALDRLTKLWFMKTVELSSTRFSFFGIVETTFHANDGLIGNLRIPTSVMFLVILLAFIWIFVALYRAGKEQRTERMLALALITGGALGNLWDRLTLGFVFDWLLLFHRSVINLADIAIACGVVWLLIEQKRKRIYPHTPVDISIKTP